MKPLRLVLLSRRFWPVVNDATRNLANLGAELADRGHEVTVLTARWAPFWPGETTFGNLRLVRLAPPPRAGWSTIRWMQAVALAEDAPRSCGPDSCLGSQAGSLHGPRRGRWSSSRCPPRRIRRPRRGLPMAVPRGLWPAGPQSVPSGRCRGRSYGDYREGIDRSPIRAISPIHRLSTGVPVLPPADREQKLAARKSLAELNPSMMPAEAPLAVYIGRLDAVAAIAEVIAAWQTVVAQYAGARLWLAGDGAGRRSRRPDRCPQPRRQGISVRRIRSPGGSARCRRPVRVSRRDGRSADAARRSHGRGAADRDSRHRRSSRGARGRGGGDSRSGGHSPTVRRRHPAPAPRSRACRAPGAAARRCARNSSQAIEWPASTCGCSRVWSKKLGRGRRR